MRHLLLVIGVLVALAANPAAAWFEGFDYPNGPLAGNDGWYGDGVGIEVVNQAVQIGLGGTAFKATVDIPVITGDIIVCTLQAYPQIASGGNIWAAWFNDASGKNYARWYGYANTARPRIGGYGLVLNPVTLVEDQWNTLEVVIDQTSQTSTFYHNGVKLGSLNYSITGAAGGIGQVQLENFGRTDLPDDSILIDNISIVPEPSSLISLSVFGAGLLGYLRRRRT
jgi:hypothetical protein